MIPIDMRHLLEQKVHHITASDPGPDGIVGTYSDNATRTVVWDNEIGGWIPKIVNPEENEWIAYTRSEQQSATSRTPAYWIAWTEDANQREKIIWKQAKFIDDNGQLQDHGVWVSISKPEMRWSSLQRKFVPLLS